MVLRKPYKFLIKHFRMIHLILAILSGYLLTKTNRTLSFFNDYLNNNETLIGNGTASEYFSGLMTLFIVIILIGIITITVIMKMKDKPITFYIITLVAYIFIGVIYAYDSSLIKQLELKVLDIRTIKLASDLTLICFLVQTFSTIILSVRAVGFDLKKFNFDKDFELEIDEKDNEEFEFDVSIDKNKIKRNTKKSIRNLKYAYHENKFIVNIAIVVFIVLIGGIIYLNKEVYNKIYKKGEIVTTTQFSYLLKDSFLVNTDYRNNKITDNYIVVVRLKIKNNLKDTINLETARVLLHIGKVTYNPTTKYKDSLIDLGTDISNKKLKKDFEEYIIAFEIPKKDIDKKMTISYTDLSNKVYTTKLDNIKFENGTNVSSKLNEYITLNNDIIKNVKFEITDYKIDDKVKSTYTFCETKDNCYESYEYIVPSLTDNYEKAILRLDGDIDFNKQTIKNFNDLSDFIENYGSITYKITDSKTKKQEVKQMNTKIKEVLPQKSDELGTYYFEVYKEIKNADEITLVLNIRGNIYEYKLK